MGVHDCKIKESWQSQPKVNGTRTQKMRKEDIPGGTEEKNLPASAADLGLILGLGRFHTMRSNSVRAPYPLSPLAAATEGRNAPTARAPQREKPSQGGARAPQLESGSGSLQPESGQAKQRRPSAAKNK